MKQKSTGDAEPDGSSSEPKPIDAESGNFNEATVAPPATGSATSPTFDPASLPPLQSITVVTDIRSFLGSNVSVELTKAAMPGFGPLRANDIPGLVGLGKTEQARGVTTEAVDAEAISATRQIDEIDHARAQEYALLAALLSHSPDAQMIEQLARLSGDTRVRAPCGRLGAWR